MVNPAALLEAAEDVATLLQGHQVEAVVIGGAALAAYHYVRHTEDIDLGVNASVRTLQILASSLQKAGYPTNLYLPDQQDPLSGVIDVETPSGLLQIISFSEKFPAVIDDAIRVSHLVVRPSSRLKLVPLPHLIALKLYAGGHKSKADIVELLLRNPNLDLGEVRDLCKRYRLRGLEELIREAQIQS